MNNWIKSFDYAPKRCYLMFFPIMIMVFIELLHMYFGGLFLAFAGVCFFLLTLCEFKADMFDQNHFIRSIRKERK